MQYRFGGIVTLGQNVTKTNWSFSEVTELIQLNNYLRTKEGEQSIYHFHTRQICDLNE